MFLGGEKVDGIIQSGVDFQTRRQTFLGNLKFSRSFLQAEKIGAHTAC
jgi:hypothetical protein